MVNPSLKILRSLLWCVIGGFLLASCGTAEKIVYVQDIQPNVSMALQEVKPIRLKPGDKLNIIVHSRDQEVADMFNLNPNSLNSGTTDGKGSYSYYTVDENGKIDMPILGPIAAEGLTRLELANLIKYRLLAGNLVRDPIVTAEYVNLAFYVLGEVGNAGRQEIYKDNITLLEALAQAGDLTINGRRDNVLVMRTENGTQIPYRVDLTSTGNLYGSPVYYLQQNDLVYVEPSEVRANQSTASGNSLATPSFWFSAGSFLMSLVLFLVK